MPSVYMRIKTPPNPTILCVANQRETPTVWIEHDVGEPDTWTHIDLQPTGEEFDATHLRYIGTVLMHDGALVWHAYARLPGKPTCREPRCVLDEHEDSTHHDGTNSWSYT